MLARSPGFTAVALVTLTLGIAANTTMFTVANALLLRALPYEHPQDLVLLFTGDATAGGGPGQFSLPMFEYVRDRLRSVSGIAAFTSETFSLTGKGDPEQLPAARVTWDFFQVLGVHPGLGRSFLPEEDTPGNKPAVLISHSLWKRRFGGDRDVIGRNITLDTASYTIIGVTPAGFRFDFAGNPVDIWTPRVIDLNLITPEHARSGVRFLVGVARLKTGTSLRQANAELEAINRQYQKENPQMPDAAPSVTLQIDDLREQLVANIRPALLLLSAAVGFVLLIACANVANLFLSRALGRKKEIAVRMALGGSRGSVIRQLLTESLLLAVLAGTLGVAISIWSTQALSSLASANLPRGYEIGVDARVLGFTAALSLFTGVFFGLFPAFQLSRSDPGSVLREDGRGATGGPQRQLMRSLLVVSQVSLSTVLLIVAGLLARSFTGLLQVSPGFDSISVLSLNISLPPARYSTKPQMVAFYSELVRRVEALPGVQSVSFSSALPLNPVRFSPALPEGQPVIPLPQRPIMAVEMVGPWYFRTMRIPLRAGREFGDTDDAGAARVAVVNETLVRRFWPNERPIGKRILLGRQTKPVEVVGIVGDVKNISLAGATQPEIYIPYAQLPWPTMNLILRTAVNPHGVISAARREVSNMDKDQPVTAVQTMEEVLQSARAEPRLLMLLLGGFTFSAFVLAAIGIYGVIAYSVAQRTPELGIRLAIGAGKRDILRLVLGQGTRLAAVGIAVGLVAARLLTRLMSGLVYGVSVRDPFTFLGSVAFFGAVAVLASYVPARRATRINPIQALRCE